MRVDLHAELRRIENSGPADSAPYFTRLARFSFNWAGPLRKISKAVASRDTKLDSGRELTNSNLSAVRGPFRERKSADCHRLKPDNGRIGLDRKSGQAFLDPQTITEGHRLDFHSGKTVDQPIPTRKSEDSPRSASTGETPQKKRGQEFFSRDVEVLFQAFYVPSTSFWTSVNFDKASIPSGVVWNFDLPSSTTVTSIPLSRRRVMYFSAATKLMFDL